MGLEGRDDPALVCERLKVVPEVVASVEADGRWLGGSVAKCARWARRRVVARDTDQRFGEIRCLVARRLGSNVV